MNGRQHCVLKVSYTASLLFCKMFFVLCNVKLGKYRCHGMSGGMTRASFSATGAPWERACSQGMVADISASHTLVRQPLLRVSCPWRSRGHPCPALLSCIYIVPGKSTAPATEVMRIEKTPCIEPNLAPCLWSKPSTCG